MMMMIVMTIIVQNYQFSIKNYIPNRNLYLPVDSPVSFLPIRKLRTDSFTFRSLSNPEDGRIISHCNLVPFYYLTGCHILKSQLKH
jgi:hypothetical protein